MGPIHYLQFKAAAVLISVWMHENPFCLARVTKEEGTDSRTREGGYTPAV